VLADEPATMVVNGVKQVELAKLAHEPVDEAVTAPTKPKAKRQRQPSAGKPAPGDKPKNQAPKEGKDAAMLAELKERWIPFPELLEFTAWLPHTLRGYISRIAKAEGWTLERDKVDGVTCYRIKV
jgi:Protein of unknown function (DUF3489)